MYYNKTGYNNEKLLQNNKAMVNKQQNYCDQ